VDANGGSGAERMHMPWENIVEMCSHHELTCRDCRDGAHFG
jgi:hypothetical protein